MHAARRGIANLRLPPLDGSPVREEMTFRPRKQS